MNAPQPPRANQSSEGSSTFSASGAVSNLAPDKPAGGSAGGPITPSQPEPKRARTEGTLSEKETAKLPSNADTLPSEPVPERPGAALGADKPSDTAAVRPPSPPQPRAPASRGKRALEAAMVPAFAPTYSMPTGMYHTMGPMWPGMQPSLKSASTKQEKQLLQQQQQQLAIWAQQQQEYQARLAAWQQQHDQPQQQQAGGRRPSASFQSKMNKAKVQYNKNLTKEVDALAEQGPQGTWVASSIAPGKLWNGRVWKDMTGEERAAYANKPPPPLPPDGVAQPVFAGSSGAATTVTVNASPTFESSAPEPVPESKVKKLWNRLEDAYDDQDKLEALILEILHDQPTILAAAVDSDFGQSIRHATVLKAVWEARPMLNLLVGILSKYVPVDAWNREVRPMCEQLSSIFGKPGLFCGHAQGAKELKAAELVRNPPENASQRKGRDGRTPKSESEGVVSMYGKRLLQSCRCDSSKCLKMYCTCFRNETRCNTSCVCLDCHNDGLHEEERLAALRAIASQAKKPRFEEAKVQTQAALLAAAQDPRRAEKEKRKRGRAYTKSQINIATKLVLKYERRNKDTNRGSGASGAAGADGAGGARGPGGAGGEDAGQEHNGGAIEGGSSSNADAAQADGVKSHDIPRTGTFENEAVWAAFCMATGEVNHRAINLWDRVQRENRRAKEQQQQQQQPPQQESHSSGMSGAGFPPPSVPVSTSSGDGAGGGEASEESSRARDKDTPAAPAASQKAPQQNSTGRTSSVGSS